MTQTQSLLTERQTVMGPVHEPTLVEMYRRQVELRGDMPAMVRRVDGRWVTLTWAEYAVQASALAAFLVKNGLAQGDHVAIWTFNRPEFVIASTASMLAGGSTAPLYQTLSATEAAYVLAHSDAPIAVVENTEVCSRVLSVRSDLPKLRRIILIDGEPDTAEPGLVITWAQALEEGSAALEEVAQELESRSERVQPGDVATLVYTSGTTGPPKAVMATHANLIAAIDSLGPLVLLSPGDRVLSYLPLAHILERLNSEVRLYAVGSTVWFASAMAEMPADIHELRPTCFVGVPRVWEKMAATINAAVEAMPPPRRRIARWAIRVGEHAVARRQSGAVLTRPQRVRLWFADRLVLRRIRAETGLDQAHTLITGAAPISVDLLRFFHGIGLEVLEGYGMSENMTVTTLNRHGRARIGSVGQVVPGVELRIAADGEILMRGDVVFAGYYKDPAAYAETVQEGWLHTGDIGELDSDGYLRITDRKKDLIITAGGKNVSPRNIEEALRNALIANAVVIGDRRPYLAALLALDASGLQAFATEHNLAAQLPGLSSHPAVLDAVRHWVDTVNGNLANVEKVRRWAVLPTDFSVGIELTPTFKVRRKVVGERYAQEIERLYASSPEE
ncbi:MAG TPA: long-chain fatty acid--CoA ligase [Candidatus Acidoferrales bacterium]|nr:long-chain fatty acid--CoA ligase [Candidatus Acidoferrales bacterium]